MGGLFQRFAVRLAVYKGARSARLWRSAACAATLLAVSLPGGGCTTSVQIGSGKDEEKPLHTASIRAPMAPAATNDLKGNSEAAPKLPPEADLAFAKVAAAEVLTRGGKDASAPWENTKSGARGTVTPLASAYRVDGALCRDFLASHVSGEEESWMQGEACKTGGKWEVRRLKPWRRT